MNYYSSEKPGYLKADGQFFELRVAEVVGWKNKGKEVIVRFGPGEGWGYSGYANLDVASNDLIEGVYELAIVDNNSGRMPTFIRE